MDSDEETGLAFMSAMIAQCTVCGFRGKLLVTNLHCIASHPISGIFFDFPTREETQAEIDAMSD